MKLKAQGGKKRCANASRRGSAATATTQEHPPRIMAGGFSVVQSKLIYMSSEIAIPVVVKVKLIAAQFWGVVEPIDGRTDESLGILNSYGFDDSPELSEQVMIGVVEAILEKEKLVTDASYRISLKVVDDRGRLVSSSSRTFRGHSPPEIPMNWRLAHKKPFSGFFPMKIRIVS